MTGLPDRAFHLAMLGCALAVLVTLVLIVVELVHSSQLSLHHFGWKFFLAQKWDPVSGDFGALPFIYGTLVSSLVALVLAVPLGLGVAIFNTEMCPPRFRGILSFTTELLAAIPSVIYGYYGGVYIQRRFFTDPKTGKPVGYGEPGSKANRDVQEGTFGIIQTLWKNERYGALQLITQASYLERSPWSFSTGAPKNAHLGMGYVNLRYVLP